MSDHPSYDSMMTYMGKAVENREAIYQADREAVDALLAVAPTASSRDQLAAKQKAWGTAQVKELVSNNRWNMTQAIMFGVASIARTALGIHHELRLIRGHLERTEK